MKISFDNISLNQKNEVSKENFKSFDKVNTKNLSECAVLPSNSLAGDYENGKSSLKSFKDRLSVSDVDTVCDAMTVMANTMSSEDFMKACKDGVDMSDVPVGDGVTILDRIKLAIKKAGVEIEGFTDTIDKDTLNKMTGNVAYSNSLLKSQNGYEQALSKELERYDVTLSENSAEEIKEAYERIGDVDKLSDGMKRFLVIQKADPTIDNLFIAKHSVSENVTSSGGDFFTLETGGYLGRKSSESEVDSADEIIKLLKGLGASTDSETISSAKWLIDNNLYVTKENLSKVSSLSKLEFPVSAESFSKSVAIALSEGKAPKDAVIGRTENIYEKALRMSGEMEKAISYEGEDIKFIKASRVLSEVRLAMTSQANLLLLKSDFSIDTKDMEEYVERLKEIEKSFEYRDAVEVTKVAKAFDEIKKAPLAVVNFVSANPLADVEAIHTEALKMTVDFKKVSETYEAVGTKVRTDLGDSFKKAFSNVDSLIDSIGLIKDDETRRCVRILGYNRLEITRDNVERIRESDRKLSNVIGKITPADTLNLIRKGSSPIKMTVDELNEYLEAKEKSDEASMEKYSKFLYKLERNNDISAEDREQYIEVYRLFYELKKGDYAAIGSLINSGRELSLANLKEEIKTRKHGYVDVKVDAGFGLTAFEDELSPERLMNTTINDDTDIYKLMDEVVKVPMDEAAERDYREAQYSLYREAMNTPTEVVEELVNSNQSVTINNLLAADALMKFDSADILRANEASRGKLMKASEKIKNSMTGGEELSDTMESTLEEVKEEIVNTAMESDTYIDVKALSLLHRQMTLAVSLTREENYKIPVEIDGEYTLINLKVVHDKESEPSANVSFATENFGSVNARFSVDKGEVSGIISTNFEEAVDKLKEVSDKISENISVVYLKESRNNKQFSKISLKDNVNEVSTAELYKAASDFVKAIATSNR